MRACPSVEALELLSRGSDGSADAGLRDHLAGCGTCRARLESLRANNALLAELLAGRREQGSAAPSIDGYEVRREIRRGGQGVVYLAEQRTPQRLVALKVLLDGGGARARRFEREIELAAALRHPNIIDVHEGGSTADGRLFYAMEFVDGAPLDALLKARGGAAVDVDAALLARFRGQSLRDVLGLFLSICDAVVHAHGRGVIHRDLKPANVLMDRDGRPRVLDFGLARPVDPLDGSTREAFTREGDFVGTLAYAAPEQLAGDPAQIDVRTDVYALGVILHELLTGALPHDDPRDVADRAPLRLGELVERIQHVEPAPLDDWRQRALSASAPWTPPRIPRDLETITRQALAKQPERRYASADALARDVRNYLADRPIEARRDSAAYVASKFVARNKLGVAGATGVLLLVVGFSVSTFLQSQQVARERDNAVHHANNATKANAFLSKMLRAANPQAAIGNSLSFVDVIDRAAEWIEPELGDTPEVEAEVRHTLGQTYGDIGLLDKAAAQLEQALEIRRRVLGESHSDTLHTQRVLAELRLDQGRAAEAAALVQDAQARTPAEGDARGPKAMIDTLHSQAKALAAQEQYDEAAARMREVLEMAREALGADAPESVAILGSLASVEAFRKRWAEAEPIARAALEGAVRVLGEAHPSTISAMNTHAFVLEQLDRMEEAEDLVARAVEIGIRAGGETNLDTLNAMKNHFGLLGDLRRFEEAIPLGLRVLEIEQTLFSGDDRRLVQTYGLLSRVLRSAQRYEEALPFSAAGAAMARRVHGGSHPTTLILRSMEADALWRTGDAASAESAYCELLPKLDEKLPGSAHSATAHAEYGAFLASVGRLVEAERELSSAVAALGELVGVEHGRTQRAIRALVDVCDALGEAQRAGELRSRLVDAPSPR